MKHQKLTIESMLGGAAVEMIDTELQKVFDDIQDLSKEPKSKRTVKVAISFVPDDKGTSGQFAVAVESTLGKQKPRTGFAHFGLESGTGIASEIRLDQPSLPTFDPDDDADEVMPQM